MASKGYRRLADERARAMQLFVQAETPPSNGDLAEMVHVNRETIRKWRHDDRWDELRNEHNITPLALASRIKKALVDCITKIESLATAEDQLAAGELAEAYVKQLDYYSRILVRIDGWYDVKGSMLQWSQHFVEYLRKRGEKELLKNMAKVLPEFYSFIEQQVKK